MRKNLTDDLLMRRSAINLTLPSICALLVVVLIGAIGKADPAKTQQSSRTPSQATRQVSQQSSASRVTKYPPNFPGPATVDRALSPAKRGELVYNVAPVRQSTASRPRTLMMEVTAYCACRKCCGPDAQGLTASGRRVSHNAGKFVAADTDVLPFRTKLIIPGYANEKPVEVLDRGGAIKGNKLDVFFPSHEQALKWGRQQIAVTIVD